FKDKVLEHFLGPKEAHRLSGGDVNPSFDEIGFGLGVNVDPPFKSLTFEDRNEAFAIRWIASGYRKEEKKQGNQEERSSAHGGSLWWGFRAPTIVASVSRFTINHCCPFDGTTPMNPSSRITRRGFLAGTACGLAVGAPLAWLAARRFPTFDGRST